MIINRKVYLHTLDYQLRFSVYLILILLISCNSSNDNTFEDNTGIRKTLSSLNQDSFYLAFRSGDSKESQMSIRYNLIDTTFSHVGLLIYKKKWVVVNIFSTENDSDFRLDDATSFFYPADMNVSRGGIYEPNQEPDMSSIVYLRRRIDSFYENKHSIKFDYKFSLENDKYYCSELVVQLLSKGNFCYNFEPNKKVLTELESSFLGVDTLIYYPVDKLQCDSRFTQLDIW